MKVSRLCFVVLFVFSNYAFAVSNEEVCSEYGSGWKPLTSGPIVKSIIDRAVEHTHFTRVVVCLGSGSILGTLARSGVINSHDGYGLREEGWAVAIHQIIFDRAPKDVLDAIIFHEIGHRSLGHVFSCGVLMEYGNIEGYTRCEHDVDRFAARQVGACVIAKALRYASTLLHEHGSSIINTRNLEFRAQLINNDCH